MVVKAETIRPSRGGICNPAFQATLKRVDLARTAR
jgi:hypothetical protein